MSENLVVGTDGSEAARAAIRYALDLGKRLDATVHIVTVVEPQGSPLSFDLTDVDELNAAAEDLVDAIIAESGNDRSRIVGEVRRGRSHEALLGYAADVDADLLIVGQQGGDRLERALLGSTADRLARMTDIPLTIVPRP